MTKKFTVAQLIEVAQKYVGDENHILSTWNILSTWTAKYGSLDR